MDAPKCLLQTSSDIALLQRYIYESLAGLVERNFPYDATNADGDLLPPHPLEYACAAASSQSESADYLRDFTLIFTLVNAYRNYSGHLTHFCVKDNCCGQLNSNDRRTMISKLYQDCTQFVHTRCTQGPPNDVFLPADGGACTNEDSLLQHLAADCSRQLEETISDFPNNDLDRSWFTPRPLIEVDVSSRTIVLSSEFAPCSSGVLRWNGTRRNTYAFEPVKGTAAGMELRQPSDCDPPELHDLRYRIVHILLCWRGNGFNAIEKITGENEYCSREQLMWGIVHRGNSSVSRVPIYRNGSTGGRCCDLVGLFPWGRSWKKVKEEPANKTKDST